MTCGWKEQIVELDALLPRQGGTCVESSVPLALVLLVSCDPTQPSSFFRSFDFSAPYTTTRTHRMSAGPFPVKRTVAGEPTPSASSSLPPPAPAPPANLSRPQPFAPPLAFAFLTSWIPASADPNYQVCLIAFGLGAVCAIASLLALPILPLFSSASSWVPKAFESVHPRFAAYLVSWTIFHLCEYLVTSLWNPSKVSVDCELDFLLHLWTSSKLTPPTLLGFPDRVQPSSSTMVPTTTSPISSGSPSTYSRRGSPATPRRPFTLCPSSVGASGLSTSGSSSSSEDRSSGRSR